MALTTVSDEVNPIKCTGTASASEEIKSGLTSIKFVYWYNPTTAGDLLSLIDQNGNDIVVAKCEADGESQILPVGLKVDGIHCDDMDSGTLYIYIK